MGTNESSQLLAEHVVRPQEIRLQGAVVSESDAKEWTVRFQLDVDSVCFFMPALRFALVGQGVDLAGDTHQLGWVFHWLPRGSYRFLLHVFRSNVDMRLSVSWGTPAIIRDPDVVLDLPRAESASLDTASVVVPTFRWEMESDTKARIAGLPWQEGHANWFFRHFDHAATVITEQFLRRTPKLRGRILDVGAGDGITDLGIFLRYRPEMLVAVDIVDYVQHLPSVASKHGLPISALPEGFRFCQCSAESIPYPNAYFDIVLSWGSVEHVKGGYRRVLDEVWRLLKPGGLFFVNPGLYYGPYGSHLDEFFTEPHHHLKMDERELREHVLNSEPRRIDRSGWDVPSSEYWRFYQELNRIRVGSFESELKSYGYRILRATLRAADMVEYDDRLQQYSIVDLSLLEAFFVLEKPSHGGYATPGL
jgi:SAM-dependent methyltransferase